MWIRLAAYDIKSWVLFNIMKIFNNSFDTINPTTGTFHKNISMKDTYAKREYKCKCGRVTESYEWQSLLEFHKVSCYKCGKELGIDNLAVKEKPQLHSIRTDTKNR